MTAASNRVTRADLEWWLDFAKSREWTFAKTYAASAPHDYIVQDRTPGVTHDDIVRATRVICTFGRPGKYYSVTKIYLDSPDGETRWWTEDRHFTDATLVNRASNDRSYGVQNAPSTVSGIPSPYDEVATSWDADNPIEADEAEWAASLLGEHRGPYPPHVLDIGCGTGRVLDLSLVRLDRYAALDSSQAMLNLLVRKYPTVAAVYPMDARDALAAGLFTPGQFDWVVLDTAVALSDIEQAQVRRIASRAIVIRDRGRWEVLATTALQA